MEICRGYYQLLSRDESLFFPAPPPLSLSLFLSVFLARHRPADKFNQRVDRQLTVYVIRRDSSPIWGESARVPLSAMVRPNGLKAIKEARLSITTIAAACAFPREFR